MNAQKLQLNPFPVKIHKILKEVEQVMSFQILKKGLKFIVDLKGVPINKEICTDENRLMQILFNLLSNATKFTLKGEIKLLVEEKINVEND